MILKLLTLTLVLISLVGCGGATPKKSETKQIKSQNYGVVLDKSEQLTALTNYLVKKELGIKKPSFPKKPQKPTLLESIELVKGDYEKSDAFEMRVNAAKRKRARDIQVLEDKYAIEVTRYNDEVKRLTDDYNSEIEAKSIAIEKSKQKAIIVAYNTIYGKPFVEKNLDYDADAEKFYAKINSSNSGFSESVLISVPVNEAENFQENIEKTAKGLDIKIKDSDNAISEKIDSIDKIVNKGKIVCGMKYCINCLIR